MVIWSCQWHFMDVEERPYEGEGNQGQQKDDLGAAEEEFGLAVPPVP